jgi:hypothetical protein
MVKPKQLEQKILAGILCNGWIHFLAKKYLCVRMRRHEWVGTLVEDLFVKARRHQRLKRNMF